MVSGTDTTIVIETTKPNVDVAVEDGPVNLFRISPTRRIDASYYQSLSGNLETQQWA
jgi:hypothetical protein